MSTGPPPDVLWLDGMPDEAVALPVGEPRRALGSDPFAAEPAPDPVEARLAARLGPAPSRPAARPETARRRPAARPTPPGVESIPEPAPTRDREPTPRVDPDVGHRVDAEADRRADPEAASWLENDAPRALDREPAARRRRRARTPRLEEVELPDVAGLAERWLDDDVRRRLAALGHLAEGGAPYDRFGFSPAAARNAFPWFHALYRAWFRVRSVGHANLPVDGPALLAANHGGLLPFDGAMTVVDVLLHTDPPRLARAVVDRWAGTLPWVNVFFARVGQIVGTRENVMDLLDDGQLVLVFPEGMAGVRKNVTQRYRLQRFHVGFVEAALKARAPIVPTAVIGADDQAPILADLSGLARRLSLPFFPVTPTFPWLGPLGLVPYPVPYRIVYGEPLRFHERFGPEAVGDAQLVRYLANRVRREVQLLVDRHR